MATTHALAGMALASVTAVLAPEYTAVAVGAAAVGGFVPDFDLYGDHRRTLHYPIYYSFSAVVAVALAALSPATLTVALAAFLASAALHCVMDAFGGGLELRPWEATSERAVYSHYHGRWLPPRRWVRYDGAPEDVLLATGVAAPSLLVATESMQLAVLALLGVSVLYATVRKPMARLVERLVRLLPVPVVERLPERFTEVPSR